MRLFSNNGFQKHYQEVRERIDTTIGEGVSPSNAELSEWWNNKRQYLDPQTFVYIYDLKANSVYRSAGFSILGKQDNWTFNSSEYVALFHENQQLMIPYKSLILFEFLLEHHQLIRESNLTFSSNRGIKGANGEYLFVNQSASSIQFDANGYTTKYFNTYRVVGPYNGEPFTTRIYSHTSNAEIEKILTNLKKKSNHNILEVMGFSNKEQMVIKAIAQNLDLKAKEIGELLGKAPKTVKNHQANIFNKAKELFPLNDFQNARDVVKYLKLQEVV
ncbi:MAG: LuxR C-terminal-related transcriptional regulator [Bacteroidota bacterium]